MEFFDKKKNSNFIQGIKAEERQNQDAETEL
jgi:hypothetical protein